jgi:flagellar assembly protein FliH
MLGTRLRMRQQMEEDLVHLAVAVARRILHRELSVDPEALLGIVKAAIHRIDARELHRVRVAAADVRLVETCLASLNLPARVEVASDSSLPRGSVVLETTRGSLDSSVETQLQEIDRGFADLVRRQAS